MAVQYGLGNFVYELTVKDGEATFDFSDPNDASNTATVSVSQKDFPEGVPQADSRQVADLAYSQCAKILNDKRDARLRQEQADDVAAKQEEDARQREEAADFFNNSQELADTTPTGSAPKRESDKKAPAHTDSRESVPDDSKNDKNDKKK